MTQQIINIGSTPNDRTGDTMVVGARKINANFTELYTLVNDRSVIQSNALAGTTLASNVVNSSLTSVGTLGNLTVTNPIHGSVTGNAGTVTNGVYTNVAYHDPDWITTLNYNKIVGLPLGFNSTIAGVGAGGTLGGVKVDGTTITIDGDGVIRSASAYSLPTASTTVKGGVIVDGTTVVMNGGVLSAISAIGTAAAGGLTGTTLASNVVHSSLTSVGTLSTLTVSGVTNLGGTLNLTGDLVVNGTSTTINSTTLTVDDKNIELGTISSPSDITANGGGIILKGTTDKSILWLSTTGRWTFNTAVEATSFVGNASTATKLAATKNINGTAFDGSADVTVTAAASTLTGTTLNGTVVNSSLTSVGTLTSGAIGSGFSVIPNSALANSSVTINGNSVSLGGSTTVAAAAGTLTGTILAGNVLSSSLTSVGTIATGVWNGTVVGAAYGGTGQSTWATGDILYASATNTLSKLARGVNGQLLTLVAGVPGWADVAIPTAGTGINGALGGVKVDGTSITISNGIISTANTLASRGTVAGTTASLANNATGNLTVVGFKGYLLYKIQTSVAAWVRIYTDSASRTADASRAQTSDPSPGSGIIAEVITSGAQTIVISPGTIGFNNESSPTTNIELAVTNLSGSSSTVTVTLTIVKIEG